MNGRTAIILVCPGMHSPVLTAAFLEALQPTLDPNLLWWVLPYPTPPYSPQAVLDFLESHWPPTPSPHHPVPLIWLSFSAGVVGAIAAARTWRRQGHPVTAFIALDGWGVPLAGDFPIFRLSHDRFTAYTSEWPQRSAGFFYAEPGVEHLELWRSPQTVSGIWIHSQGAVQEQIQKITAAAVLREILRSLPCQDNCAHGPAQPNAVRPDVEIS